ncbi:hypothetical protein CK477_21970 [Enterobacter cloacae]|nr:hypothetical protein CK477_21970 [Enterobacter cloacae]
MKCSCNSDRNLFTKHAFDKIFPVPHFTFNHNNLSYYYAHSTETYHHCEATLSDCCDCAPLCEWV